MSENKDPKEIPPREMPFMAHLEELRTRLIRCILALAVGFGISMAFRKSIFSILLRPLPMEINRLSTLHPSEGFMVYLTLSFWSGALLAFPVIVYQTWKFVSPGLYKNEKKLVIPFVFFVTLFFFMGVGFCYQVVYPFTLDFFMKFNTGGMMAQWTAKEYFSFSIRMLFAFGLVFELPFVMALLARTGVVPLEVFTKNRRMAIVAIFILSAFITPPDAFSQMMMAFPLLMLYEFGILLTRFLFLPSKTRVKK